jgi:sulfide:quinone oxidoreductase
MTGEPHRVVIAGGGVAGLEALLALRALAGDRVELTLVSPAPDFFYRPAAVAEPFARGDVRRTPLAQAAASVNARFVCAPVTAVEDAEHLALLDDGRTLAYDSLLVATGAASTPAFPGGHVLTWDDTSGVEALGGLLRDLEEGYTASLAVVVPPRPGWPPPAYELALLIAHDARGMGMNPQITLVTTEEAPLEIFGSRAIDLMSDELARAGVRLETGAYAELDEGPPRRLLLHPSGRRLVADRIVALPRLRGRAPKGIPVDADGFVPVDSHGRVAGVDDIWAAGDVMTFTVKLGGLAAEQADAAAADIAVRAGALVERTPFRPVLRDQLLTPTGPRYLRHDAAGGNGEGEASARALWSPPSKIAARWLAPWLAALDDHAAADHLPRAGGMPVQVDLHRDVIRP